MTASTTPTIAPPYAIRVWSDGQSLYAEIPGGDSGGAPHVLKLAHTEAGLMRILRLLAQRFTSAPVSARELAPRVRSGEAESRSAARNVLKLLGMV